MVTNSGNSSPRLRKETSYHTRVKEKGTFQVLFVIGCIILMVVVINHFNYLYIEELKRDYSCYISHVQECLLCQEQNLTYLLCSGFCVQPREQHLDMKGCPNIHPTENCFDLPKECNFP